MKKSRSQKSKARKKPAKQALSPQQNRRDFMRLARNGVIALPFLGAAGFFGVRSVQATIREADLSLVGNGQAAIVQIHDPSCALCATLQKQTRKALKVYEDDRYEFLVANITTSEGSIFAARFGVPHVTLLLFDGQGELKEIVRGPIETSQLEDILSGHMRRYGKRARPSA